MNILLYCRLRLTILRHFFEEIPWLMRLLLLAFGLLAITVLLKISVSMSVKSYSIFVAAYSAVSLSFSPVKKEEATFLMNNHISISGVILIRKSVILLIAVLIHPIMGGLCLPVEVMICYFQSKRIYQRRAISWVSKMPQPFPKRSIGWISVYRRGGFLTFLLCYGLVWAGYIHNNNNLIYVAFGALICFWGMAQLTQAEPDYFITIYPSPERLFIEKSKESIVNLFIIAFPGLSFFLIIGEYWCLLYTGLVIIALLQVLYIKYSYFPGSVFAAIVLMCSLFVSAICIIYPAFFPVIIFLELLFFYKSKNNLAQKYYVNTYLV